MKTSKYLKTIAFCALMLAAAMPGKAQVFPNTYINIDWQVGVPLGAGFADKASGWGMNFEGGYFVTPAITVGPFISYQTNLEKIPRQTITLGSGNSLTTNQKHALFQLHDVCGVRRGLSEAADVSDVRPLCSGASEE